MFNRIGQFLDILFADLQTTFLTVFAIGLLICAIGVWAGDDHSGPKFKKGLVLCAFGVIVFLLAGPIVEYIDTNL
ncbi:hypothetical protein [Halobacillus amylolyticus]|uniref:TrbC/VIRB2 family protein n=1 Tax=Halobacillus amylolyticus TaxID=2932259 RepID=A0ABY4HJJ3_9BACI|nr:hypothetical protein [Halobacillus amylolyticus]UOR14085.1 hypothetical protein MUO15_21250 [Halobacillus amylolyticus]